MGPSTMPYPAAMARRLRAATCFAPLVLAACAGLPREVPGRDDASLAAWNGQHRDARELALQRHWIGRTRGELVREMGPPSLVMGMPGRRWPEAFILVYRRQDPMGGCIDAFVVHRTEAEPIANYFCR
jgi:hypothetical protein